MADFPLMASMLSNETESAWGDCSAINGLKEGERKKTKELRISEKEEEMV
jgi:hypothetical protein